MTAIEEVDAGQKKEEERLPDNVSVRHYDLRTKTLLKSMVDNVKARKYDVKGEYRFDIDGGIPGGEPKRGSEITEKDGTVWTVTKSMRGTGNAHHLCIVTKKSDPPKKD